LDLVSAFVIHTTEFLNKFASSCEEKLNKVESNIKQMEITLNILETKLNSIEGLKTTELPPPIKETTQEIQTQPTIIIDLPIEEDNKPQVLLCKEDPKLEKYFKMLKIGNAIEQIKHKMVSEGIDPKLLDTPNEPSPFAQEEIKTEDSLSSGEE